MKQMKTLTVNGVTYEIADPDAAHIDDAVVGDTAWSGKNTVDRLCPQFTQSGPMVACAPVEGYPLTVKSSIRDSDTVTLYHCGKNLFDVNNTKYTGMNSGVATVENGVLKVTGAGANATFPIKPSTTYAISYKSTRTGENGGGVYVRCYNASGQQTTLQGNYGNTLNGSFKVTTATDAAQLNILFYGSGAEGSRTDYSLFSDVQVELGSAATAYEPYTCEEHTAQFGEAVSGVYDWQRGILTHEDGAQTQLTPTAVPALPGGNTLWSEPGETEVTGRADPVAVIEKLTNAIIALGGNL